MLACSLLSLCFVRSFNGEINVSSHDFSGLLPIQHADIRLDDGVYDQWWIVLKNIVPASIGDNRFSVGLSIRKLAVTILPSGYISLIRKGRILRHQIDHWNFWRKSRTPHDFNGFRQSRRLVVTAQLFGCWLFFALPFFYEMFDPIVGKSASGTPVD